MNNFFLFYLLSLLTGNPLIAIAVLLIIYFFLDRAYVGFLPDIFAPIRRNRQIKNMLTDLSINPSNSNDAIDLGVLYFEKKQYEKAVNYFMRAYDRVKNSEKLYLYLGMAQIELGRFDEGKEALIKALQINPNVGYGIPYVYLIKVALSKNDIEEVKSLEDKFSRYANTENFYKMGIVFKKAGDKDKAKNMFDNAVKEYSYCPRTLKKLHRRWAFLSKLNR
jgi:tetratricopeptide (TPR) repeat protein